MIAYIKGELFKKEDERLILLTNNIGYEIIFPAFFKKELEGKKKGDELFFYIYYHQTERQPKPILIGFTTEEEKNFFQKFISVEAIGPLKAVKAMIMPVHKIASAIEAKDVNLLKSLKGVGERTAKKIIAALSGKMESFALVDRTYENISVSSEFTESVLDILINRLGYKPFEAKNMIDEAFIRNKDISSSEELFDEIYRK
jgi:holliday junction DNA helicase RuvA